MVQYKCPTWFNTIPNTKIVLTLIIVVMNHHINDRLFPRELPQLYYQVFAALIKIFVSIYPPVKITMRY